MKWLPADLDDICKQIASGIQYLHSCNIIHRDIKVQCLIILKTDLTHQSANILVFLRNVDVIRIADFGVSKTLEEQHGAKTLAGTHAFMAPEVWDHRYDSAADSKKFPFNQKKALVLNFLTNPLKKFQRCYLKICLCCVSLICLIFLSLVFWHGSLRALDRSTSTRTPSFRTPKGKEAPTAPLPVSLRKHLHHSLRKMYQIESKRKDHCRSIDLPLLFRIQCGCFNQKKMTTYSSATSLLI